MATLKSMNKDELNKLEISLNEKLNSYKEKGYNFDMSRGKPCSDQLNISMEMLDIIDSNSNCTAEDGVDCRNYGDAYGIPEAKKLFSELFEVNLNEIIIGGNSSLNFMYDTVLKAMQFGVLGSEKPWSKLSKVKFLCPSPGYDRHFSICEAMGIEMVIIDMKSDGPDMDQVERLVASDESIKGIWCVPKYSNPEGIVYSDEVVLRLAKMKTKAPDFRIFWDNAYVVHSFSYEEDKLKNILQACKDAGNKNRVNIFGSTSKVSFSGSGISIIAASEENINCIKKQLLIQTIGNDKLNQLRHVKYLKDVYNVKNIMSKHAAIIKPKFDTVLNILDKELGEKEIGWWKKPNGGYFISFNSLDGCAKEIVAMAKEAGVIFTPAGATYPYRRDPRDRNIRIAPTYPPMNELKLAIEILCICVQLVSIKKIKDKM